MANHDMLIVFYRRADDGEIANILIRAGLLKPTISIEDIKEGEK